MGLPVPDQARMVYAHAEKMRRTFPAWRVRVQIFDRGPARIEVVNRDGHDPWVMISSDPAELWATLRQADAETC